MLLCAAPAFTPFAAHADGWVPCDANGAPLASSDPDYDRNTGGAVLLNSGKQPDVTPTGVYSQLTDWWKGAYSPNTPASEKQNPFGELGLSASASNLVTMPYYGYVYGFYAPNGYNDDPDAPMPDCPDIGGEAAAYVTDDLTAHFVWTGPGSVPNPAYFFVSYSANASAGVWYESSGLSSGLSSYASASLGPMFVSATASSPGPDVNQQESAKQLKQFTPDSAGMVTISAPATINSSATNGVNDGFWTVDPMLGPWWLYEESNGPTYSYSNASANGVAAPDSRAVTISSTDIDVSHRKGPPDESGNPTKADNVPNAMGVTHADSVVDWDGGGWDGGLSLPNGRTYVATTANFVDPSFSWGAPGEKSELDIPGQPTSTIDDHIYFGPSASGFPQESTFTVNATDTDGATATNTYTVNWHMPYEKTGSGPSWETKVVLQTRITGLSPSGSGTIVDSPAGDFPIGAVIDAVPVVGDALKKIFAAIMDVSQWIYHANDEPAVENGATNNSTSWTVALNDSNVPYVPEYPGGPNLGGDPDGWMYCKMDWCRFKHESGDAAYADSFDVHGYNSSGHYFDCASDIWFDDEPVFYLSNP